MTMPNAPAVKSDMTTALRSIFLSSYMEIKQPGRMPQLPAVGDATILPIAALQPDTAKALLNARVINEPHSPPPETSA